MAALPARNIRNVETDSPEVRPRDAAIRSAANDNNKYGNYAKSAIRSTKIDTYANDNSDTAYPTVDQSFEEYAEGRTIQPTQNQNTRGAQVRRRENTRTSTKTANSTRSVTTEKRTSRPLRKPGIKRFAPNVPVLDVNAVSLAKGTSASITNLSWGMGLWMGIQLPLALVAVALFGVTYIMKDVIPNAIKEVTGEVIYEGASWLISAIGDPILWLVNEIFGIRLDELLDPANYFMAVHFLVFMIGFATLILCAIIYQLALVNCVFGKHSALKIGTLIFATFAYMVPVINIIPWFIFWVLVVWRYPE